MPLARHALELVRAAVFELEARAGDEVPDGARSEHLACARQRRHAGARVDGDAADFRTGELELAGVQAEPDLQAQRSRRIVYGSSRSELMPW